MAAALPDGNSSNNWNISKDHDDGSFKQSQNQQLFSLRSFSSLGGGDAPLLTNIPRMRSQLFTISTRAVMTSHSQMSVNYTTGEQDCTVQQHFSSASSSVDSEIDEINIEQKPLNTDSFFTDSTDKLAILNNYDIDSKPYKKVEMSNVLSRSKRCVHGSFEDLRAFKTLGEKKEGNRRKSAPTPNTRGQMIQAANELLVEENKQLAKTIQALKKKLMQAKIATMFTLEALKRRGKVIKSIDAQRQDKERQCAARLILHSLLLNSWRNTRRELDMRLVDNAELRKSVENLALQVQVLRHVQSSEKQKAQEKATIIQNLNEELQIMKEENQIMRKEVEKMENELNSLQASSQNLMDENNLLNAEITALTEKKDKLVQSLDWERIRSEQFSKENSSMKENLKNLEAQLKEATEQRAHWQERARCSESEAWELQLHLESRDSSIKELTAACSALRTEKMKLIDAKSQLKTNLDRTTLALQTLAEKNDELSQTYERVKAEKELKTQKIHEMETALKTTKLECSEIERELLSYKLQNVRKRREWANALYFIVSPMDAVRRKLL